MPSTLYQRLTLSFNALTLVVLLVAAALIGPKLVHLERSLPSPAPAVPTSQDATTQALNQIVDNALRSCSGALDDRPVTVLKGHTLVGQDGTTLTCTQDRVAMYGHA